MTKPNVSSEAGLQIFPLVVEMQPDIADDNEDDISNGVNDSH